MEQNIMQTIETPLGDATIREYLPDAKIITNKDLQKYESLSEIFNLEDPTPEFIIILFEDAKDKGHWTCLSKYGNSQMPTDNNIFVEFFDSYGNTPNGVYNFIAPKQSRKLNIQRGYLDKLLSKINNPVIYNPVDYQKDNTNNLEINTCGRHVTLRIIELMGRGTILSEYFKKLNDIKERTGMPYDLIVSKLIYLN